MTMIMNSSSVPGDPLEIEFLIERELLLGKCHRPEQSQDFISVLVA